MKQAPTIFIFDFDGTIADTYHYLVQLSNKLANEFGYATIPPDEVLMLKDKTIREVIKHLNVPFLKIPAIISRAKKEFQKDVEQLQPFQGLKEILEQMKTMGARIGILSSNAANNIQLFLQQHDLNSFDFVCSTTNIWGKHISIKKFLQQNNLEKDQVIYIGDEIRDIMAAKKLGIRVAAVTWGYNSPKVLKETNPDFLCATPEELLEKLQSLIEPTS